MKITKLGRVLIYLLATSPNWVIAWSMYPAGWGKVPLVVLAVLALLALSFFIKDEAVGRKPAAGIWVQLALFIFAAAYLVAGIFGVDPWKSFWGEQSRQNGFFMLVQLLIFAALLPKFLRTVSEWRMFDRVLFWSAAVPAAAAAFDWLSAYLHPIVGSPSRFSAWIDSPVFFGGYLALAFFVGLRLWTKVGRLEKIAIAFGFAFIFVGLLVSGSRGALLALVAGLAAVGLAYAFLRSRRLGAIIAAALAVVALFGIFAVPRLAPRDLPGPFGRVVNYQHYFADNVPRLLSWKIAWHGFTVRPLTGFGPENFQTVFDRYYDPKLLKYSLYETVSDKPHNLPLEILSTGGLLLALAYVGLLVAILVAVGAYAKRGDLGKFEAAAIFGLLAAYFVNTFFLFDVFATSILIFALVGLLLAPPGARRDGLLPEFLRRFGRFASKIRFLRPAAAMAGFVLLAAADVYAAGFGLAASAATLKFSDSPAKLSDEAMVKTMDRALWLSNPYQNEFQKYVGFEFIRMDTAGYRSKDFIKANVGRLTLAFADSIKKKPDDFMTHFVYGQLLTIEGEYANSAETLTHAVDEFRAARDLSPGRQAVSLQLAKVLLIGGKNKEAVALLRQVAAEDLSIPEPHWYLGLALRASGDQSGAAEEIKKSLDAGREPASNNEAVYMIDVFAAVGRYADIVPLYQYLIYHNQSDSNWHARLAATYAKLGKPELAVAEAQKAAELDPSFAKEADDFIKNLKP